jgi:hypothetical protein
MITASRTTYTEAQQDANWDNLSPKQRAYFNRLADGDPERTGQAFFEDEVPAELQNDPIGLDIYLNGGTVTVPVDVHDRGRAGTTTTTRQVEIEDRDWSHDVSKANGGSDSADNGRFESASTNRARGADNSTAAEQAAADEQSASDAEDINNRVDSEQLIDQAAVGLAGGSLVCDAAEFALEGVLPVAMGLTAAAKLADAGVGKGAAIGGGVATGLLVLTPPGQIAAGAYLTWKLAKFGINTVRKLSN